MLSERAFETVDRDMGNCVGNPFCPGIEVTWTTRNPNIYEKPWSIRHRDGADYANTGLDPARDETERPDGCEPGDLTKRMAIPWQADFYQCSVQNINFTDPARNNEKDPKNPEDTWQKPPVYYTYWWPPQSPWRAGASSRCFSLSPRTRRCFISCASCWVQRRRASFPAFSSR